MASPLRMSLALLVATAVFLSVAPAQSVAESQILGSLLASPKYQEIAALLQSSGLVNFLHTLEGPLTFFFPTDAYFQTNINRSLLTWLKLPQNKGYLTNVLKFHATRGKYTYKNFTDPPLSFPSLDNGALLHVTLGQKNLKIRLLIESSPLKKTDSIISVDGAVHGIDGFLIPPSIQPTLCSNLGECGGPAPAPGAMTIIEALLVNGNSELVNYLESTGIAEAVNSARGVTILAPTNEAFKLFLERRTPSEAERLKADLQWILWYHVVQGYHDATDLSRGINEGTYHKGASVVTVNKGGVIYINPQSDNARVVRANLLANGVESVQGIDRVLLPPGFFAPSPDMAPAPGPMSPAPAPAQGAAVRSTTTPVGMLLLLSLAGLALLF